MKNYLIIFMLVFSYSLAAQENTLAPIQPIDDTTYIDTLNKNLVGLNVFPALGLFGSGRMPTSKISLQYKHMYSRMNIRASLNFINYYRKNDFVDIWGMDSQQVINDSDTTIVDSLIMRQFYNNLYTYDIRFGAEASFSGRNYSFYVGGGLIGGYHFVGEYYYHYNIPYNGYPVNFVSVSPYNPEVKGYREIDYLKVGADITIGVDINISPNCVVSVQYAPEIVFYKSMKESLLDPDKYYVSEVNNELVFVPDYIDLIVSIRF
ncbi:MAG: hypothetical protein PHW82_12815 [Bacteroidales bacterium]|nr:hypothetical protein [Bacteroidales bacterium]